MASMKGVGAGVVVGVAVSLLISWVHGSLDVVSATAEPSATEGLDASKHVSEEEAFRAFAQHHRDAIRLHWDERVDPAWASTAEAAFELDLSDLGAGERFEVTALECRQLTCVATLRWSSYEYAKADAKLLLHHPYILGCSVEVSLEPPTDPKHGYTTQVLFGG